MNDAIKVRILQGDPIIHNVRNVQLPELFRAMPVIEEKPCAEGCTKCVEVCPTGAVGIDPVSIDLGKCVFCPLCEENCPEKIIHFTQDYFMTTSSRDQLVIPAGGKRISPGKASEKIRRYFGRSLKLRQISAGGCNGCELELNALSNVNFDLGRYGVEFVASPRHADGVVLTGPITRNMAHAAAVCLEAVPNPKIVILVGACAISGGIFQNSPETDRTFLEENKIDLFIPGCPPHPLTFMNGLMDWLDKK